MKKLLFLALALVLTVIPAGCTQPASAEVKSDKARITAPQASEADLDQLVSDNSRFALNLYQVLKAQDGNLFYSPYSVSLALAMTYAGARGQTGQDMAQALEFSLPQDKLHAAFNSLDLMLKQRGQGAQGKDGEGFRLNIVNAIWGQKDYQFMTAYLDLLAENYGAGLRVLDFIGRPDASRTEINNWVSEQTEGKIKDLIPEGGINDLTRLVLTNAVYFNAAWLNPFEEDATSDDAFTLLDGATVTVPMMHQSESYRYLGGDGYQAVELPYDGNELSMLILLPSSGQFEQFESGLDAAAVQVIIDGLQSSEVILSMPRFEYESSFGLKQALTDLGMGLAFTPDADFSGMSTQSDLHIQDVAHKAFVSVDEAGTEAAAATAVIVGTTSAPAETVEMKIDRPFIFLIRDTQTGSIIFLGRVLNPAG